jgi:uncharacterized membrane protein YgdD (TMEM256/DUF423 family)
MERGGKAVSRTWIMVAALLGALGVALGAFGAHILRAILPLQAMTIFETAVRYHLLHTLALLGTGLLMAQFPGLIPALRRVAWLFLLGILLFSGSLYVLSMSDLYWMGFVTPIGGLAWVAAWLGLAWTFWRVRRPD